MAFLSEIPGRIFLVAALAPLLMAIILFLAGTVQRLRKATPGPSGIIAGWLAVLTMAFSAACSIIGTLWLLQDYERYTGMNATIANRWTEQVDYLHIGGFNRDARPALAIPLGFAIDRLTALMMCMVTVISTLVFLYSLGYMHDELKNVHDHAAHVERRGRFAQFFQYLLLFAFSMLVLLISDNLLQVFVSWELVGVCSFLLIGFYYERKSASTAANKAFIMNRVGDAGFLIALAIAFTSFGYFDIGALSYANTHIMFGPNMFTGDDPGKALIALELVPYTRTLQIIFGLGLFAGCVGKSAQFPLQTWLPDAMEGPTPVSALIHAATMVAAGVYLCARCLPMFATPVLEVIAWIGGVTMLLSALTACVQTDIKRVLAFSTCSQLGMMMLALGLSGLSAGLFHLLTHAFFKALLFLAAGSVIYGMHHEQNLMKMGGVFRRMPITASAMLVGVLAIIGFPLFSGWYSKDAILAVVYEHIDEQPVLAVMVFLTAILTAYYMLRLWLLVFAGPPRSGHHAVRESPAFMTLPLVILAVFSIGIAWGWPVWDAHASALLHILEKQDSYSRAPTPQHDHTAGILAGLCMVVGVMIALFRHYSGVMLKAAYNPIIKLLQNRFYFDALYDWLFTKPTLDFSRAVGAFDKQQDSGSDVTLDGTFTGAGTLVARAGRTLAPFQSGQLRGYVMLLGLTAAGSLAILWILIH